MTARETITQILKDAGEYMLIPDIFEKSKGELISSHQTALIVYKMYTENLLYRQAVSTEDYSYKLRRY